MTVAVTRQLTSAAAVAKGAKAPLLNLKLISSTALVSELLVNVVTCNSTPL